LASIAGVFLDAVEPSLIRCASGGFKKNASIARSPLVIAGRRYARGIGVAAPSHISVSLDTGYRRFQSWVGLDTALISNYMDRSAVTFEVRTDGRTRWISGVIRTSDPPEPAKWIDIDVTGAGVLELAVTGLDSRGHSAGNWADWAEARLLK